MLHKFILKWMGKSDHQFQCLQSSMIQSFLLNSHNWVHQVIGKLLRTTNQHPPTVASRGNNCHFGADRCDRVYMESQENRENARIWYDSSSVSKSSNRKTSFFSMLEPNLEPVNFPYFDVSILQKSWPKLRSKQGVPPGSDHGAQFPRFRSIQGPLQWRWFTMEQNKSTLQGRRKHIPPQGSFGKSSTQKAPNSKEEDMLYVSFQDNKHSQQQKYKKLLQL